MIGKTLLYYEIIDKLGEGGMGEVYRARDTKLARLEESAGRLTEARHHYETYLECWGNADVAIPDVDDARKRLANLNQQM